MSIPRTDEAVARGEVFLDVFAARDRFDLEKVGQDHPATSREARFSAD
jgi:hypothetical protein